MGQLYRPQFRPLFRKKSNTISRATLFGIGILILGTGTLLIVTKWTLWETEIEIPIMQPVPFSHKHHVSGLGLDCRYCHTSVTVSAFAGLPPTHTCMTCHSQIWQEAPLLKPIRESFAENTPLKWNRINRLPKYVYFNHSIHISKGIGCSSCHGKVEEMPLTWKARSFYMRDCLSCHREPEKHLRQLDQVFDSPWNEPWHTSENQLEIGARLIQEHHIPKHRLMECNTCHR